MCQVTLTTGYPVPGSTQGGAPSTTDGDGHSYAGGNTEELLRAIVFGLPELGAPTDPAFDRLTGVGWVAKRKGQ